jgi:formate dehydrogenase subunit beta
VAEVFAMVGEGTQAVFGYEPGRSVEEAQPLATFVEDELLQVTGQTK